LLEPRDCCVAPVLTVEEAREHLLFRAVAEPPAVAPQPSVPQGQPTQAFWPGGDL
jgi:hypothetical protein